MRYRHTQIGYVTGGGMLIALLIVCYSVLVQDGPLGVVGYAMIGGFGVLTVLFSSLTVTVTDRALVFYFGPGFWTRRFALADIERVEVVRTSAIYGWGIRYTAHGWLYNVSGLRAVEVTVRGQEQLRIGTDEPEALKRALDQARSEGMSGSGDISRNT